jgi:hypothetical protein
MSSLAPFGQAVSEEKIFLTLANFHSDGKEDNDSDMLNNLHSGYFNIGAASRKSRGLIQSGPFALLISNCFGISST